MVTSKLRGKVFNSKGALWGTLVEAFGSISPASLLELYDSLPSRHHYLKAKGGYTR